jgi:hypothetical protein
MNCYKHQDRSAVAQCSCGNYLCRDCHGVFDRPTCDRCFDRQISEEHQRLNGQIVARLLPLAIIPLYIPWLLYLYPQFSPWPKPTDSITPVCLGMVWAILRSIIWKNQKAGVSIQIYEYGCGWLLWTFISAAFISALGIVIIPFDIAWGLLRIAILTSRKLSISSYRQQTLELIKSI